MSLNRSTKASNQASAMASLQKEVTYPLTLIPDYLTFEDASNQIKTSVTLSNETNDRIAFRVRTNAPKGNVSFRLAGL